MAADEELNEELWVSFEELELVVAGEVTELPKTQKNSIQGDLRRHSDLVRWTPGYFSMEKFTEKFKEKLDTMPVFTAQIETITTLEPASFRRKFPYYRSVELYRASPKWR